MKSMIPLPDKSPARAMICFSVNRDPADQFDSCDFCTRPVLLTENNAEVKKNDPLIYLVCEECFMGNPNAFVGKKEK